MDPGDEDEKITRWDVPTDYLDGYYPHYC